MIALRQLAVRLKNQDSAASCQPNFKALFVYISIINYVIMFERACESTVEAATPVLPVYDEFPELAILATRASRMFSR